MMMIMMNLHMTYKNYLTEQETSNDCSGNSLLKTWYFFNKSHRTTVGEESLVWHDVYCNALRIYMLFGRCFLSLICFNVDIL
jgi:hypothetical protein